MFSKIASRLRHRSLALRLALWYAGSAFLLVAVSSSLLYAVLASSLEHEDDQVLADTVYVLIAVLERGPDSTAALKQEAEIEPVARRNVSLLIRVYDPGGSLITESPTMASELPPAIFPPPVSRDKNWSGKYITSATGRPYEVLAVSADVRSRGRFLMHVALGQEYERGVLERYRRALWVLLSTALLVCAVIGYVIARQGLRPVADVTAAAARIRSSTLGERFGTDSLPAELASLGTTFNSMLDRLQDSFTRLTQFSSDIAHELRTPVNNLRGEIEVTLSRGRSAEEYRHVLESALEECNRLTHLIDRLLFLARTDNPDCALECAAADLTSELDIVREFYDAAAQEFRVDLGISRCDHAHAFIDRVLFQQAIGNVVENALAHSHPGGKIELALKTTRDHAVIMISDTGCGIAAEHLDRICDRLYRADNTRGRTRGGAGLGLSIVSRIMSLHHGRMEIRSKVDHGTTVALFWPLYKQLA